jgi:hypothetical protein
MRILAVISLIILTGCASLKGKLEEITARKNTAVSYIQPGIGSPDSTEVTNDMARFLQGQLPAAKTTLALDPLRNPLHDELVAQLTRRGFGIIQRNPGPELDAVTLRYMVTTMDSGILVRMSYQHQVASRFYNRAMDGRLSLENRYSIREAAK